MKPIKDSLSVLFTTIEHSLGFSKPQVTILGYHGVSNDKTIVDIDKAIFEKQLSVLEQSFQFVTLDQVVYFIEGKATFQKPVVALTFDDGYADVLTTVEPILKEKNIPAALFVMSDSKHANRDELANNKKLLTMKEIKFLSKQGWTIGCHSATHAYFADKNLDLQKEINLSKKELEKHLGFSVKYFAYPKGLFSPQIVNAVKNAGFTAAFTFEAGHITQKSDLFTIARFPVDWTHTLKQFSAFFSNWGTAYLGYKQKTERMQQFYG